MSSKTSSTLPLPSPTKMNDTDRKAMEEVINRLETHLAHERYMRMYEKSLEPLEKEKEKLTKDMQRMETKIKYNKKRTLEDLNEDKGDLARKMAKLNNDMETVYNAMVTANAKQDISMMGFRETDHFKEDLEKFSNFLCHQFNSKLTSSTMVHSVFWVEASDCVKGIPASLRYRMVKKTVESCNFNVASTKPDKFEIVFKVEQEPFLVTFIYQAFHAINTEIDTSRQQREWSICPVPLETTDISAANVKKYASMFSELVNGQPLAFVD